mmetsp:Transcript_1535/g.4637  ORF Transcript_1535/g.4637 Transcript_1535/m.4637 type:complete len:440 (+) Transcript_1535:85-1404(+)
MKVATSALLTFAAVPFSPLLLAHIIVFALNLASKDEVGGGPVAFLERDDCPGGACAFSTLQHRARGVKVKDATRRSGSRLVNLNREELESLVEGNMSKFVFNDEANCTDLTYDCEELAQKWMNCMNLDTTQVPPPPKMSLSPMKFLQKYCRKTCGYCGSELYTKLTYLRQIRNDEVDKELSYSKVGDFVPLSLTGIFWMDQRGLHKEGTKCDPDFKYNFGNNAANELVFGVGDGGEWNESTRCIPGQAFTGRQGHWTYMNEGSEVKNRLWYKNNFPGRVSGKFCFRGKGEDEIEIPLAHVPTDWHEAFVASWLAGEPDNLGLYRTPKWLLRFTMHKTCFGWARKTTVGPDWLADLAGRALYYPIFQIVDGYGQRTEHWDHYVRAANTVGTNCNQESFYGGESCNTGDGTSWVPVTSRMPIPADHPAHEQMAWLLHAGGG